MPTESLATVDQLSAFLQQPLDPAASDAVLYLNLASNMVRDYLQQDIDFTSADVVLLDPLENGSVFLPQFPVVSVDLVEVFDGTVWSTVDPSQYTVSRRTGMVTATDCQTVVWPYKPESWRVTYSHGFTTVPQSIVHAVLGVAARLYASPVAVDMERIGGYQVKYSTLNEGFSAVEKSGLSRYMVPRIS